MEAPFAVITCLAACTKLLFISSYHSTDFEVHRNWLAITYSLPLSRWYFEEQYSIWSLDYPPFFAYFEYVLAQIAAFCDKDMLVVSNVNYLSKETLYFQRISVVLCDLVLCYSTYRYITTSPALRSSSVKSFITFSLIIFNAGLILVDNIHFQYNGYLLGMLVYCLYLSKIQSYPALAAVFSMLVLSKHLFAPLALPFGVYLLRAYCFPLPEDMKLVSGYVRFLHLFGIATFSLVVAFGPFLLTSNPTEQLTAIFTRLFPFGRGLVHAYWAPNFWALYAATDRMSVFSVKVLKKTLNLIPLFHSLKEVGSSSSLTTGLVGDVAMSVLPDISASTAIILVVLAMIPSLIRLNLTPTHGVFMRVVVNCTLCMFVLGYHVHEKAILVTLIPLSLISFESPLAASLFLQISFVGIFSLFPLFSGLAELPVKCAALLCYVAVAKTFLCSSNGGPIDTKSYYNRRIFPATVTAIACVLVISEIFFPMLPILRNRVSFLWVQKAIVVVERFQFLPLMIVSVTCAISTLASWIASYMLLFEDPPIDEEIVDDEGGGSMKRNISVDEFSFLSDHIQEGDSMSLPAFYTGRGILKGSEERPKKPSRKVRFSSWS
jgi:alpha-1,3-glucosyltransferase